MQQSSAPLPQTPTALPAPPQKHRQTLVEPPKRSRAKPYIWLGILAGICGGLYWLYQRNLAEAALASKRAAQTTVRTTTVAGGKILSTLRLTGTTGPEKYFNVLGPQMRGSRSFMGGGGGGPMGRSRGGGGSSSGGGGGSSAGGSVQSNSSSGGSSSSFSAGSLGGSVASTSGSSGGGSSSGGSSAAMGAGASVGGVRSASSALRASTSRSSGGGSARSSMSSGAPAEAASGSMGTGMGSTSGQLMGGGGPGGGGGGPSGGGDFGAIIQELVKPGARVKKGDKLVEFDRQFMLQRLEDYRSGVLQQELNITRQMADIDVRHKAHDQQVRAAKADRDKAQLDLKTIPVRSAIDSERFKLAIEEAEAKYQQVLTEEPFVVAGDVAQVKISQMDFQQSKLELRRSEQNAERMVVRSAMDGMVVMMQMFRGADFGQVQQGDPVQPGQPFMQVVDPDSMIVNALMNQVDVERIRVGAKANIHFDAFPDLVLPGHVFSVAAMPRASNSSRANFLKEIPVRIKLDKLDPRVIPDLSVSVDVIVQEEEAATMVPLSSIHRDASQSNPYVWVKNATGWERRDVKLGLASHLDVSVLGGLKLGDVVAEEKPPQPVDGTASS
ncbi:MAG: HlyD family efflux transporter periplasmic adaptor subunit [Acidobacteria bacterium]|nr:HlyD family efflux transporter periplasmic adaptor subunit [Acidobacteriota bacterium]